LWNQKAVVDGGKDITVSMAEILRITTSIVSILQLTGTVIKYLNDFSEASKECSRINPGDQHGQWLFI